MNQLIKLNNKISNHKNDSIPIKIAFQSSIMKYVERKKKESAGFATLNQNWKQFQDKNIPIESNLISKNTQTNFHQPRKQTQNKLSQQMNSEIDDRKTRSSFIKKKSRGHKSSLSDWRTLYGQREDIIAYRQGLNIFQDKKVVTGRFFSTAKKMTIPDFQNEKIKRASYLHLHKIELERQSEKKFKKGLHIEIDQNMRGIKYLRESKHRRQTSHGFRLFNEVFTNQQVENQKNQKGNRKTSMFEENSQNKFNSKKLTQKNRANINWKDRKNLNTVKNYQSEFYQHDQIHNINPQIYQAEKGSHSENKKMKNLSKIFSVDLKMQESKDITLKFFRPKKTKVQMAISRIDETISQQNLCKGKNSPRKHCVRQGSTNWKTLYNNF